jgi:AAA ATPase domain
MSPKDREEPENPFSPGYGQTPPYLAGRDEVVASTLEALRRGPGRGGFHQLLIAPRGTGKTAVLTVVAEHAVREHGAVVVRWTAGSRSLTDAIGAAHESARKQLQARWRRAGPVDVTATVGVPGVAAASASRRNRRPPTGSAFGHLEELGRLAAKQHRTVILWIDEAQSATEDEIRTVAAVMQELANVQQLPVAVHAGGLPETRFQWINAASFLERQQFATLGALGDDDTAAAIEIPIREAGRRIDFDALQRLVHASKGHPYTIQLMGSAAWDAATGSDIDATAARQGIDQAIAVLQDQLFVSRWRQLTPSQRRYVETAASIEDRDTGEFSSTSIAIALHATTKALSKQRDELIRVHQLIVSHGRDRLAFAHPGLGDWIRQQSQAGGAKR